TLWSGAWRVKRADRRGGRILRLAAAAAAQDEGRIPFRGPSPPLILSRPQSGRVAGAGCPRQEPIGAFPLFHVKHSFADAELAEDHVEEVFDIDSAGDATEGARGEAQILGRELRQRCRQASLNCGETLLERRTMTSL